MSIAVMFIFLVSFSNFIIQYEAQRQNVSFLKRGFHTVIKIESRSFSSAEIQHFRTENTRSD
jgi:hypothetical protein